MITQDRVSKEIVITEKTWIVLYKNCTIEWSQKNQNTYILGNNSNCGWNKDENKKYDTGVTEIKQVQENATPT